MEALTFVFAPCVPSKEPHCMIMVTLTTVLLRFACSLFPLVALHVLNFPLCCCSLPCTPSLLFRQRAAALPPSFHYIDPPALFFMLPCFLYSLETLESLPYILPCLSNLKTTVPSIGVFVIPFYICSFFGFLLFALVSRWLTFYLIIHCSLDRPLASKRTPVCPRSFSACSWLWNPRPYARTPS